MLSSKLKPNKPILPKFDFKESAEGEQLVTYDECNCENCGKKPVTGTLYKCANCEDYNLCEVCYSQGVFEHFSYHIFMKFTRALKHTDKNPTSMMPVLDPRLYPHSGQLPEQLSSPTKKRANEHPIDNDDLDDLQPLNMGRSMSMPMKSQ